MRTYIRLFLVLSLVLAFPSTAWSDQEGVDLSGDPEAQAIKAETERLQAETQSVEAEAASLSAQLDKTRGELEHVQEEIVEALPGALVAWFLNLIPSWPYAAAALILLLLLVFRPQATARALHPAGIGRFLRQIFARSEGPSYSGLRIVMMVLAVLMLLAIGSAAVAQEKPTRGKGSALDLARASVAATTTVEKDRVALERLRGHESRTSYRLSTGTLAKMKIELYDSVVRDSFEHLFCLAAIYLELDQLDQAVANWSAALEAPKKGSTRDFERALAAVSATMAEKGRFAAFPTLPARLEGEIGKAALLIQLSERLAATDAALSSRLLEKARGMKKDLEDMLALLSWEKRRGSSDESAIAASVEEAIKQVKKLKKLDDCANVAETAHEVGFPEVARASLARGLEIKVTSLGQVQDIVRVALQKGYDEEARGFVRKILSSSKNYASLLEIAQYASLQKMPEIAKEAMQKAIDSGRSFGQVFEVVRYIEEHGERPSLEAALERAMEKIKTQEDGQRLADYARGLGMDDFADRTLIKAVEILNRPGDLEALLLKAIADNKLGIAREAAVRLAARHERHRVKEIPASLDFPTADLAHGAGVSAGAMASLLDAKLDAVGEAIGRLEPLLPALLDQIIFGELRKLRPLTARLNWNDFGVLAFLYLRAGDTVAEQDLMYVLRVLEPIARVKRGAPKEDLTRAQARSQEALDKLKARLEQQRQEALDKLRGPRDDARRKLERTQKERDGKAETLDETRSLLAQARDRLAKTKRETMSAYARFGAIALLLLLGIYAALASAAWSASEVTRFRAYAFFVRLVEMVGWELCMTIVGIPLGILLVLIAQACAVLLGVHDNTFRTEAILAAGAPSAPPRTTTPPPLTGHPLD